MRKSKPFRQSRFLRKLKRGLRAKLAAGQRQTRSHKHHGEPKCYCFCPHDGHLFLTALTVSSLGGVVVVAVVVVVRARGTPVVVLAEQVARLVIHVACAQHTGAGTGLWLYQPNRLCSHCTQALPYSCVACSVLKAPESTTLLNTR
jgi:hypothetical protein